MLDEIDKLGRGIQGDPASALLEVLDPEQNSTFRDNYLGVPFDLSRVMFICTANVIDNIPGPLRDRMEIIDLPAYTEDEKFEIAMRTSVPGVATGLAWTPVGGDILFIEATRIPGKGSLILTGQLGEVMRASAQAAMSLVKARAQSIGLDPKLFETSDIHIHVPAGA